eukprot:scaffold153286_cov32-Tisochrysis_lutea.AAC.1
MRVGSRATGRRPRVQRASAGDASGYPRLAVFEATALILSPTSGNAHPVALAHAVLAPASDVALENRRCQCRLADARIRLTACESPCHQEASKAPMVAAGEAEGGGCDKRQRFRAVCMVPTRVGDQSTVRLPAAARSHWSRSVRTRNEGSVRCCWEPTLPETIVSCLWRQTSFASGPRGVEELRTRRR